MLHAIALPRVTSSRHGMAASLSVRERWRNIQNYPSKSSTMNVVDPGHALGGFLRAHRERMAPSTAVSGRRRTPGLRREELAASSGLSVSLIAWLEQGRDVSASAHALSRLAKALNLTSAERAYLFELAGKHDPSAASPGAQTLPPPILALPENLTVPAYLLDDTWVALAW